MRVKEINLEGLVGPTHHYAGLALGNLASLDNALKISNPQAAARQGLAKMRLLHQQGVIQGLLPPHQRPNLTLLAELGFSGTPIQQIEKAYSQAPMLLSACYSASSMWTANSATVSASIDTLDQRVHFTAANLISNLHRSQEAEFSAQLLKTVFSNQQFFYHHPILPKNSTTADEGAANHSRLCETMDKKGINLFVYGKSALKSHNQSPYFPARQTLEASEAIARSHLLDPKQVIFACQNPNAINKGVFHNDLVAVANESVLLIHQDALIDQDRILAELRRKADFPLVIIEVSRAQLSLDEAVSTYLFNSQLISIVDNNQSSMILIAPIECQRNSKVSDYIGALLSDHCNPITKVLYVDLKQSMQNGGGPACLRLRVPLSLEEYAAMNPSVLITESLLDVLEHWISRHYRTRLEFDDLRDPKLMNESFSALDELTQLLNLGSIYPFQQE